jgi:hypothetical protein
MTKEVETTVVSTKQTTKTIVTFARDLQRLIDSIDAAPSNNLAEQQIANALYIASVLEGAAKPFAKAKEKVKTSYSDKLTKPTAKFDLIETSEVIVSVKVDAGRNSFDKDAFITTLVKQYGLSGKTLHDLAETTVKTSANVVTITAEVIR